MDSFEKSRALVMLRGALGDTLLAWPALSRLPARLNVTGLTLVGNPSYLSLLNPQPSIKNIRDQSGSDWAGLYMDPPQASPRLKALLEQHDVGVVLAKRLPDPAALGLERLGVPKTLTAPSWPKEDSDEHVAWRICRHLGLSTPFSPPLLRPSDEGIRAAGSFLNDRRLDKASFVVLHPGSGGRAKNWPLSNWVVAAHLLSRHFRVLFLAGPAEEENIDRLAGEMPASAVMAVNLSLPAVAGLLHFSRGYAGHDSGVSHLAAMMGRPVTALFGPTNPDHWRPLGPKVKILAPPRNDPHRADWHWLDAEAVADEVVQMLDNP